MIEPGKETIKALSRVRAPRCVSIFVPTWRGSDPEQGAVSRTKFRNKIKEAEEKLEAEGMRAREIDTYLEPFVKLLKDDDTWRKASDGLAAFRWGDEFRSYQVPVHFETLCYVGLQLYLKPLVPMVREEMKFWLLLLSPGESFLFEATPNTVAEASRPRLEDVAHLLMNPGEDDHLQFRSVGGPARAAVFHGHGGDKDTKEIRLERYLEGVDKALEPVLNETDRPLVVAATDPVFYKFREVSAHKHIWDKHVPGNFNDRNLIDTHERAVVLLEPWFDAAKREALDEFRRQAGEMKVATDFPSVFVASSMGMVDTLFVRNRSEAYGTFDEDKMKVELADDKQGTDLLNLAVLQTISAGGRVFLLEPGEMPVEDRRANAILRY